MKMRIKVRGRGRGEQKGPGQGFCLYESERVRPMSLHIR